METNIEIVGFHWGYKFPSKMKAHVYGRVWDLSCMYKVLGQIRNHPKT